MTFGCPVCGYDGLAQAPRGLDGASSNEVCPCCGFEFGFDDAVRASSYESYRKAWLERGAPWFSSARPPAPGWDLKTQLARVGVVYSP